MIAIIQADAARGNMAMRLFLMGRMAKAALFGYWPDVLDWK